MEGQLSEAFSVPPNENLLLSGLGLKKDSAGSPLPTEGSCSTLGDRRKNEQRQYLVWCFTEAEEGTVRKWTHSSRAGKRLPI